LICLFGTTAHGAVYNLKILSDKTVDLTDLKSFCYKGVSWTPRLAHATGE
jgi:hypothetical protein